MLSSLILGRAFCVCECVCTYVCVYYARPSALKKGKKKKNKTTSSSLGLIVPQRPVELESKWNTSLFLQPHPPQSTVPTPLSSPFLSPGLEQGAWRLLIWPCLYFITGIFPSSWCSSTAALGFINPPKQEVHKGGQMLVVKNLL